MADERQAGRGTVAISTIDRLSKTKEEFSPFGSPFPSVPPL
jgi:hypothetical protein